ncbi:MAG TPA: flagellar biosynthesis protein FlhB [Vicinamibacterales bacterium]
MSQERTEQPTGKRLQDARKKGQVARSKDVQDTLQLAAAVIALVWMGSYMVRALADRLADGLARVHEVAHRPLVPGELAGLTASYTIALAMIAGPMVLAALVGGMSAVAAQGGWNFSVEPLKPNFTRLSPANGLKRLVPSRAGIDLARMLIVATALAWVSWGVLRAFLDQAVTLSRLAPGDSAGVMWATVLTLFKRALVVFGTVAAADYLVRRWQHRRSLRMTKQEVKEEHKMLEGNPEIKGRVRRLQREMARRRMLAAVPQATVVITNPTHIAVALEYRREEMAAPRVVAMGADHLAQKIKEVARAHGVPTVENVALARALYASAEIDRPIPVELFEAVAEVLAYLVRLKQLTL